MSLDFKVGFASLPFTVTVSISGGRMLTVDWRLALTVELPTFFGVMIAVCLAEP